jgi:nitrile hydratase
MNGVHDMGGMMGFGGVTPETDEPVFHAEWERRAFALTIAAAATGGWTLDEARFARERTAPEAYLSSSYYEIWMSGLERLLLERGLVSADELKAGSARSKSPRHARVLTADRVAAAMSRGGPTARPMSAPPLFAIGEAVVAANRHPAGHTRLPRYVRGRTGTVTHWRGGHVFADSNACGGGEAPQHLYTVSFPACEIWGPGADGSAIISVDAFESYLESA